MGGNENMVRRRRPPQLFWITLAFLALVVGRVLSDGDFFSNFFVPHPPLREGVADVLRVESADRLVVRQRGRDSQGRPFFIPQARVQLLGVALPRDGDGPQSDAYKQEALRFSIQFLTSKRIRLELDKRRIDHDGCYLAYVYFNDRLLNEALLQAGLAQSSFKPGDSPSMQRRLKKAEQQAIERRLGVWSEYRPQ